jgi:putative DNA primase/helicase
VPTLAIKGRQDVHKDWRVPTLHLDANLNLDLLRWHWPTVQQIADVAVSAPHQRVDQVTDSPYAPDRFVGKDPSSFRNLRGLHALVCTFARDYAPRTLLLVAQKDVEKALKRLGLPANVDTAHHNDIAGKDLWGPQPGKPGAAALVVIGRTAPKPSDVERIAEALTGRAVEPLPYWYAKAQTAREMADGTWIAAEADRHPDPIAEAVRWTICEGEVVQIVGRPRGVNRTAADPVDVLVMTDTVLPVQLADTLAASDLAPTPVDLMLAAGGIAYANPAHAAEAYHGVLWDNREAAKKAMERAVGDKLLKGDPLLKRSVPNCLTVTYQKAGARQRPATATVDLIRHADPAAALTAALGPLAWCKPEVQPEEVTMPTATAEPAIRLISVTREPAPVRPEVSSRPDLMLLIGGNSAQRLKSLSARLEAAKPLDSKETIDKPCACGGVVFWTPGTRWLCAACQPPYDGAEPKGWTVLPKAKRPGQPNGWTCRTAQ